MMLNRHKLKKCFCPVKTGNGVGDKKGIKEDTESQRTSEI